jgi:hypothetical protein
MKIAVSYHWKARDQGLARLLAELRAGSAEQVVFMTVEPGTASARAFRRLALTG